MKVTVSIQKVQTGEVREYVDEYARFRENGSYDDFMWSEGNYGCDCNRALFFALAAGEEDPDHPCGHDQYWVSIREEGSEKVLYVEDEFKSQPAAS